MWRSILDQLHRLRAIDTRHQAFGAATHGYLLHATLSEEQIRGVEDRLGVALPAQLRSFYKEMGDGVAGPCYGLKRARELDGHRPSEPYPGLDRFREAAINVGCPPDKRGYFEAPRSALAGLLAVIEQGCGHQHCLIATGPKAGNVVDVSCDGYVVETDATLLDLYTDWLGQEIAKFEEVRTLMAAGKTRQEIAKEMRARFNAYDSDDRIVSIANVEKPEALFGPGGRGRYHGASQFPWYEQVLKEWQLEHRR